MERSEQGDDALLPELADALQATAATPEEVERARRLFKQFRAASPQTEDR